eukprot:13292421-Heterocapsa_arctica.AAC.1
MEKEEINTALLGPLLLVRVVLVLQGRGRVRAGRLVPHGVSVHPGPRAHGVGQLLQHHVDGQRRA